MSGPLSSGCSGGGEILAFGCRCQLGIFETPHMASCAPFRLSTVFSSTVFGQSQTTPLCRRFFQIPLIRVGGRGIPLNPIFNRPIVSRMASSESQAYGSLPAHTITLPTGDTLPIVAAPGVSDSDLRNAINSSLFKQWLKNLQSETGFLAMGKMCLRQVLIQGVDMFGKGVGFLKFKADVYEKETGTKLPGIVFARGPAVAVLILLESGGETYAVLTEQIRVPVGKSILELPAGMLDDEDGDVVGTATREVEEEIGITLNAEDMVNLTAFLNPETGRKVFPSPGGCDEELSLFLYSSPVKEEVISTLHRKEMGLRDHGELIKVHVIPYDKLWRVTADVKALTAIALYEMAKRDGLLPRRNSRLAS